MSTQSGDRKPRSQKDAVSRQVAKDRHPTAKGELRRGLSAKQMRTEARPVVVDRRGESSTPASYETVQRFVRAMHNGSDKGLVERRLGSRDLEDAYLGLVSKLLEIKLEPAYGPSVQAAANNLLDLSQASVALAERILRAYESRRLKRSSSAALKTLGASDTKVVSVQDVPPR